MLMNCYHGCVGNWGTDTTAEFVRDYADFLESHIESWTVTTQGTLVPGISRHYIRVNPASSVDCADEGPNCGTLVLANQPPGAGNEFPAKGIVDAGFLELVRYGIQSANDPIIEGSLCVIDAVLKVEILNRPAWRRYNHDGYGQREDGSSYSGWGKGRPWPLLTGERGHYEIAAGRDATPYLRALEDFSQGIGLIPEQIWDGPDLPNHYLRFGGTTDAAMPLLWAHSEYVKLHRSAADGQVFDLVEAAYERYVKGSGERKTMEVWKSNRQVQTVPAGTLLRIQANWLHSTDTRSQGTAIGIEFVDIPLPMQHQDPIRFTFLWVGEDRWEGKDYTVNVREQEATAQRSVDCRRRKKAQGKRAVAIG
jgi:glucoamylase